MSDRQQIKEYIQSPEPEQQGPKPPPLDYDKIKIPKTVKKRFYVLKDLDNLCNFNFFTVKRFIESTENAFRGFRKKQIIFNITIVTIIITLEVLRCLEII